MCASIFLQRYIIECLEKYMQWTTFQQQFANYPLFSLQDVQKVIPDFHRNQLDRWEKKEYLKKIKQGYYSLLDHEVNQSFLFYTANRIYAPSYVSLERALKFYGLIPEEIFQVTSVSTKKTTRFVTPIGHFQYRHLKPGLYWGYQLLDFENQKMLVAEPEKALLDYLYLNPRLKTSDDFLGMRINHSEFIAVVNMLKFRKYLEVFANKALSARAETFLTTIIDD